MTTLFDYLKDTQNLVHDAKQKLLNPDDLKRYVNRARREVAMRTQCIRRLTPISGAIASFSVVSGGSAYTAPTLIISPPDFPSGTLPSPNGAQASAVAIVSSGSIASVSITSGGAGYFQPVATISDPTGSGAILTPVVSGLNRLNQGQEVYPFSLVDLSTFPGVASIYMVKSVSIIYANYRYSLPCESFTNYQAFIRNYPFQYQYVPTVCAQFGQGTDGSFYLYPLPSQAYQMEWDSMCLPSDLTSDQSIEALPQPWSEAVCYFAAHFCYLELQSFNAARGMLALFDQFCTRYGSYARSGRAINPYGGKYSRGMG